VASLTAIGAPLLLTWLFRAFSAPDAPVHFPGVAFLAAGLLVLVALAVFMRVARAGTATIDAA
jgi:DHA1 family tetracycline resistance protein-like MFS transporter